MEKKNEPNIAELVQLDPEKHAVLSGVIESRGDRDFARYVIGSLLTGEKRRVVISGPPGNGKTTLLTQLHNAYLENASRLGLDKKVLVTQYDKYLTGTGDDSEEFNLRIIEDIRVKESKNPGAVHLIENPAIGFTRDTLPKDFRLPYDVASLGYVKDRGVTVQDALEKESLEKNDTIFVKVLSNNVVEQRAGYLRKYIQLVDDSDLLTELDRLGVSIRGLDLEQVSPAEIKVLFAKMANQDQMLQIKKELRRQTSDWAMRAIGKEEALRAGLNDFPISADDIYHTLGEFDMLEANSDAQSRLFAQLGVEEAKREAAFHEDMFNARGIGPDSRAIVFNPYNNRSTILDLSQLRAA